MLYIKLFIEREKNTGQSAPECPFKAMTRTMIFTHLQVVLDDKKGLTAVNVNVKQYALQQQFSEVSVGLCEEMGFQPISKLSMTND